MSQERREGEVGSFDLLQRLQRRKVERHRFTVSEARLPPAHTKLRFFTLKFRSRTRTRKTAFWGKDGHLLRVLLTSDFFLCPATILPVLTKIHTV